MIGFPRGDEPGQVLLQIRPGDFQQPPDQQQVLKTSQILINRRVLPGQPDQLTDPAAVAIAGELRSEE